MLIKKKYFILEKSSIFLYTLQLIINTWDVDYYAEIVGVDRLVIRNK